MCFFRSALILNDDGHWAHWNGLQERKKKFYYKTVGPCKQIFGELDKTFSGFCTKLSASERNFCVLSDLKLLLNRVQEYLQRKGSSITLTAFETPKKE